MTTLYDIYVSADEHLALKPCFAGKSCKFSEGLSNYPSEKYSSLGVRYVLTYEDASIALEILHKVRIQIEMPCVKRLKEIVQGEIRFYAPPDPWGFLGNFSRHPIFVKGEVWPSTEHYFQAQKFVETDPAWANAIRQAEKPGIAANMGRDRTHPITTQWESIKYFVMRDALFAKFTQHYDCRGVLLETKDMALIEDTGLGRDDDHIWGDGTTGKGLNLLGCALMDVRRVFAQNEPRLPRQQSVQMGTCYLRPDPSVPLGPKWKKTKRIPFQLDGENWIRVSPSHKRFVYNARHIVLDDGTVVKGDKLEVLPGYKYRHNVLGGVYLVADIVEHDETGEEMVVYKNAEGRMYVKPRNLFGERFQRVD